MLTLYRALYIVRGDTVVDDPDLAPAFTKCTVCNFLACSAEPTII